MYVQKTSSHCISSTIQASVTLFVFLIKQTQQAALLNTCLAKASNTVYFKIYQTWLESKLYVWQGNKDKNGAYIPGNFCL